jgi:fatty acid desaturase
MVEEVQREISRRHQYLQWYHGIGNIFYIVLMHAALIGWLWFGRLVVPYVVFVLLSILACLIHQRILSEWFHEATHWNIVADRTLSDWLADLLIGTFNGTRVKSNRPGHFKHHAATVFFTPDDPDTRSSAAMNRDELVRGVIRDLSGRTAMGAFFTALDAGADKAGRTGFGNIGWFIWLVAAHALGFLITVSAGYYEIYPIYFLTLLTLYPVANRFRLYVQHAWIREDGTIYLVESGASRTYLGGLFTQLFLISPMIMYHYEHHARPSLPYRALRAMVEQSSDPNVYGRHPFRLLGKVLVGL